jgi:MFS family permease
MHKLTGFARRQVLAVTLTSFFTDVSSEMITYLLPLFLANVLGAPTSVIGLIEGVAEATASLLKTVSGWLSDKLRQRKWITVAGYALSTLAKPFLFAASTWQAVLAVRFVDRAGKGIRTAPRDALIADTVDERQRGFAFGLHRAGDTAGAFVGMGIALIVVLATQSQALALTRETWQRIILISIIPAVLGVLTLAIVARDIPVKVKEKTQATRLPFAALGSEFRTFLIIVIIFTLGNSSDAFIILRAQERGLNVAGTLGMLLTFNLIYAVFSGPLGALSDRIGRQRLITTGWLVFGVIYLGFAAATTAWQTWVLFGVYGLYYALVEGSAKAFVADLVPPEKRGTAYGFYNAAVGFAALPASFLAGILWEKVGPSAPFISGAVLAVVAALMLRVWRSAPRVVTAS